MKSKRALQREFLRAVRTAAHPHAAGGWHATATGMVFHGPEGHWGEVVFRDVRLAVAGRLDMRLFAGSLSPYLMRHVNKLNPDKPPPPQFVAAHARVLWDEPIAYTSERYPHTPGRLILGDQLELEAKPLVLSPATAAKWLEDVMGILMTRVRALSSDLAIRDWLVERNPPDDAKSSELRDAALLTRHLRLDDELPSMLERAKQARAAEDARLEAAELVSLDGDRRTDFPQSWSHERFLQFLDEVPQ